MTTPKPVPLAADDTGEPHDLVADIVDRRRAQPPEPVDPGPITSPVSTVIADSVEVARGVALRGPAQAAGIGVSAGRFAAAVGRHVSDRALAGIPGPDDVAHMASAWTARAAATVTRGGFLSNGWGRFRRHRLPGEH